MHLVLVMIDMSVRVYVQGKILVFFYKVDVSLMITAFFFYLRYGNIPSNL